MPDSAELHAIEAQRVWEVEVAPRRRTFTLPVHLSCPTCGLRMALVTEAANASPDRVAEYVFGRQIAMLQAAMETDCSTHHRKWHLVSDGVTVRPLP